MVIGLQIGLLGLIVSILAELALLIPNKSHIDVNTKSIICVTFYSIQQIQFNQGIYTSIAQLSQCARKLPEFAEITQNNTIIRR